MYCDKCKKNVATVHYTKIINGQKTEVHLCQQCAKESGEFALFTPFSINDLLSGFLDAGYDSQLDYGYTSTIKCESCGMSYDDFKKHGRLGCSDCYASFDSRLLPLIRKIHGNVQHIGKVPRKAGDHVRLKRERTSLKNKLQEAIKKEEFEKAAEIRDKIKEIESRLNG
ncbi:MAG: UvrB/UvrC motif-containing protein [Clostridia bacterium]|nr:UvrB/UvrC motif-containing protein [Clostridia bacterium]